MSDRDASRPEKKLKYVQTQLTPFRQQHELQRKWWCLKCQITSFTAFGSYVQMMMMKFGWLMRFSQARQPSCSVLSLISPVPRFLFTFCTTPDECNKNTDLLEIWDRMWCHNWYVLTSMTTFKMAIMDKDHFKNVKSTFTLIKTVKIC